jgi:hypothetical protein
MHMPLVMMHIPLPIQIYTCQVCVHTVHKGGVAYNVRIRTVHIVWCVISVCKQFVVKM